MVIKMKKVFFAFFCVLILAGGNSLFAQNFDDDSDSPFMEREEPFSEVFPNDDADIESLENEAQNSELDSDKLPENLSENQRNLNIVVSQWSWNLDPQTSTYATEAQILSGLYEGLFAYTPKTLEPVPAIAES